MLNWWLGRPAEDANRDEASDHEAPETPAPVFAARAFKSAIFGTPALRDEDELEIPGQAVDMHGRIRPGAQGSGAASPSKPQGILLTPGTATVRRKTVSFGAGVVDNEGNGAISKSGVPNDCPGKFPSPWTPKVDEKLEPSRRTTLIKTLEEARDGKTKKSALAKSAASAIAQSSLDTKIFPRNASSSNEKAERLDIVQSKDFTGNTMACVHASMIDDFDGDMTLDLNDPHSHSGRYWKSEYERYHEEAKVEMRKLVKYKQLAKSYAKKKDSEAINLGEKLREEQQKVVEMEAKISELATQITDKRVRGQGDEDPDLLKDLARQTALTWEYRNQVDEFQAALQEGHIQVDQQSNQRVQRHASGSTIQTPSETAHELNRVKEQLVEIGSLRDEMHDLRLNLSTAEKKVSKLQDENAKLARDLTKVGEELGKSERRRQSAESQNDERAHLLRTLQKDYDTLKELAKSQRRDAENLLKKRYDQVAKLKKEIGLLKEQAAASTPGIANQMMSRTHSNIGMCMEEEARGAGKSTIKLQVEDLMSFDTPAKPQGRSSGSRSKRNDPSHRRVPETATAPLAQSSADIRHSDHGRTKTDDRDNNYLLDSKIPTEDRFTKNFEGVLPENAQQIIHNVTKGTKMTSKDTALSEIINNARVNNSPARNRSLPASQLSASFQERFSSLSLNSPGPTLPSPEPPFAYPPGQRMQDRRSTDSPRPSMFNIPFSPSRQARPRQRSSGIDVNKLQNGNAPSSRLSSMSSRARIALPSDRAAAAKARLEHKSAKKKRAQEMAEEKENVRD